MDAPSPADGYARLQKTTRADHRDYGRWEDDEEDEYASLIL